jgi:integrase/recombinase XerD
MHPTMLDYLGTLRTAGRLETARGYGNVLAHYQRWLTASGCDPLTITTEQVRAYQRYLHENYISPRGTRLAKGTQATRLATVKSYHAWLARRGLTLTDVARPVQLPTIRRGPVRRDHLSVQEVSALLNTLAAEVDGFPRGSQRWADAVRTLALIALGLATGRRRSGLLELRVEQVDLERNELRIEREKGRTGRVLPVATWAMQCLRVYLEQARPVLLWRADLPWVFVGDRNPQIGRNTITELLVRAHERTVAANPDLTELAAKRITPHSLRVTFASMLFHGGANLRAINELMLHGSLGITARYTPLELTDLQRVCSTAHPRA